MTTQTYRILPLDEVIKIRLFRLEGMSVRHIALKTGRHRTTVYRWMDKLSDERAKQMIKQMSARNYSQGEICRQLGLSYLRFRHLMSETEYLTAQLIELADRGLSMRKAAMSLGINRDKVRLMAAAMDNNPWDSRQVATLWQQISGETVVKTAKRMARAHTVAEVARYVGYADCAGLKKHLRVAGVEIDFKKRSR